MAVVGVNPLCPPATWVWMDGFLTLRSIQEEPGISTREQLLQVLFVV